MAIEGAAATVPLSPGERLNGLNHIAELRAKVFGLGNDSNLLIVFYVQIVPDDFVMQLHR
ncbi:DUF5347 domain-containing protein, partial [Klebsiella pneumoniae]|nr:DUF5347 domain-containing protein [Klebsiella pneumoniae]